MLSISSVGHGRWVNAGSPITDHEVRRDKQRRTRARNLMIRWHRHCKKSADSRSKSRVIPPRYSTIVIERVVAYDSAVIRSSFLLSISSVGDGRRVNTGPPKTDHEVRRDKQHLTCARNLSLHWHRHCKNPPNVIENLV